MATIRISAAAQATLLRESPVALPYNALAGKIAIAVAALKQDVDGVKAERVSVWESFKSAIAIAAEAGHAPATMRAGLEIACASADVPAGTFRGYVATVESLAADLDAGTITEGEIKDISVADARARYQADSVKANKEARALLAKVIAKWTPEQITILAQLAEGLDKEGQPEAEGVEHADLPAMLTAAVESRKAMH